MANVEGKATAITVVTPIRHGGTLWLALVFWAGRHVTATLEKLRSSRSSTTRAGRSSGASRTPGGRAPRPHLPFFESNFNGTWDQYIDAFSAVVPARMKAIWGTSYGFPGPAGRAVQGLYPPERVRANHYWSAYPPPRRPRSSPPGASPRPSTTSVSAPRPRSRGLRERVRILLTTSSATCEARGRNQRARPTASRCWPRSSPTTERPRSRPRRARPAGREPAGARGRHPLRALGDHRRRRVRGRPPAP